MDRPVLLTGASGFLGAHLARELLLRGYRVRVLLRPGAPDGTLAGLDLERCVGDVLRADSVRRAAEGCGAIVHAAASTQVNPARDPAIWAVNLTGTEHVVGAALAVGVGRLVYVGTANVCGFGPLEQPGDETTPFAGSRYGSDYIDSKRAATERVLRAVREEGLPAVLVHPTFLLGPLDAKPSSGRLLLELHAGRIVGYPAGGKNYVHVRDVAVATVNALTQGRIGESYLLGHQNLSYRDAFALMARRMRVPPPQWPIPPPLARFYGWASEGWSRLRGRPARVNRAMTALANDGHYFDCRKAIAELALPQTPLAEAIDEAFAWFTQNGYGIEYARRH